jgi:hypothetical protein
VTLAARSVALQHLESDDLDDQLRSSLTELSILGRKASAEIRIRLLPMLNEVKRRYDLGETINKKKGYHEYLRSLGLTPSTVRSWKTRDHQRIVGDVLKSQKSKELDQEEKKYEQELKDDIQDDIQTAKWRKEEERKEKEFHRKLKEDPEFRRKHEEKQRQFEEQMKDFAKKHRFSRQARAHEPEQEFNFSDLRLLGKRPPGKDIMEFASLGRREAARKYHTDRADGNEERMKQMNQVADWLEKLVGETTEVRSEAA